MADANFTRGSRWPTSSLPGPPCPRSPLLRYRRNLTLRDAGPYRRMLMRQMLHLLHDLNDEVNLAARSNMLTPRDAGKVIREMTERIHWVCLLMRAGFDRDPAVSVAQVVRVLRTYKTHMLRMATAPRFRQW